MRYFKITLPIFVICIIVLIIILFLHKDEYFLMPNSIINSKITKLNSITKENITSVSILTIYNNKVCLSEISNNNILEELLNAISSNNRAPDHIIQRFHRITIVSLKYLNNSYSFIVKNDKFSPTVEGDLAQIEFFHNDNFNISDIFAKCNTSNVTDCIFRNAELEYIPVYLINSDLLLFINKYAYSYYNSKTECK